MTKKPSQSITQTSSSTEKELLQLFRHGLKELAGIAIWRLPNTDGKHLLLDLQKTQPIDKIQIEGSIGFCFAPYDSNNSTKPFFLNPDLYYTSQQGLINSPQEIFGNDNAEIKSTNLDAIPSDYFSNNLHIDLPSGNKSGIFKGMVEKGIEEIEAGRLEKVVIARKKNIALDKNFQVLELFHELCKTYKEAFVSLVAIPNVGIWIGASPEILVNQKGNIFQTMSLAGTKNSQEFEDLKEVSWRQKEIEEQAFVSRYIINCFKKIRLREFEEHGPRTVAAGNLVHLKTDFFVDTQATNFPQLASVMLELLHPTSAVCGMPLDGAKAFIKSHEKEERKYFSGFIGPVNLNGQTSIFVNLRCMEVHENSASLYAGAGITASSDPDSEWQETTLKCNTLLSVIEKITR